MTDNSQEPTDLVELAKSFPDKRNATMDRLPLALAVLAGEITQSQAAQALQRSVSNISQDLAYAVWGALRVGKYKLVKVDDPPWEKE